MKAVKIRDNVYWVGAIDWELRNFHGYLTQRGSTYNAYLIIDKKITLIDTVKHYLFDEMLSRISSVIDPADIDIIISNHVEMDHSGSLPMITEIAKNAEILTSPNGLKGLKMHYGEGLNLRAVANGEELSLGENTLSFLLTPMVHWPDNMVTYLKESKILFSNDAFGQHYASSERFDDQCKMEIIFEEAKKYYANIVLPYGTQVRKALEAAGTLDIEVIAPSHGIIWKKHISELMAMYSDWSSNETSKKAVIVYDTMWNSTKSMAYAIADAFSCSGYSYRMMDLKMNHISDIMTEILDADYIIVGSPTLNNNILPTVAAFLTYMKGLAPKGRKAIAFGSYGWGGQSVGIIRKELEEAGFNVLEAFKEQYIPTEEALEQITKKTEGVINDKG